jgi:hypothetical protein
MAEGAGRTVADQALLAIGTAAAALLARQVVNVIWVATLGKQVPEDPADPGVSTSEAVAFAVASGVVMGVARLMVARKAGQIRARRATA